MCPSFCSAELPGRPIPGSTGGQITFEKIRFFSHSPVVLVCLGPRCGAIVFHPSGPHAGAGIVSKISPCLRRPGVQGSGAELLFEKTRVFFSPGGPGMSWATVRRHRVPPFGAARRHQHSFKNLTAPQALRVSRFRVRPAPSFRSHVRVHRAPAPPKESGGAGVWHIRAVGQLAGRPARPAGPAGPGQPGQDSRNAQTVEPSRQRKAGRASRPGHPYRQAEPTAVWNLRSTILPGRNRHGDGARGAGGNPHVLISAPLSESPC
jgi:hypothetical protein